MREREWKRGRGTRTLCHLSTVRPRQETLHTWHYHVLPLMAFSVNHYSESRNVNRFLSSKNVNFYQNKGIYVVYVHMNYVIFVK